MNLVNYTRQFSIRAESKLENHYNKLRSKGKSHEEAIAKLHKLNDKKKRIRKIGGALLVADTARTGIAGGFNRNKLTKTLNKAGLPLKDSRRIANINIITGAIQGASGTTLLATANKNHRKTKAAINKLDDKYKS